MVVAAYMVMAEELKEEDVAGPEARSPPPSLWPTTRSIPPWLMDHRIRHALNRGSFETMLGGEGKFVEGNVYQRGTLPPVSLPGRSHVPLQQPKR